VWIKRWRCPECGAVHTCRPDSHWRRFLAPITVIVACLNGKLTGTHWLKDQTRQRQQYWYRGFLIQSLFDGRPPATIAMLYGTGIVAATHSTADREIARWPGRPYRSLAATGPP
jgi:hypothetical protein